MGLGVRAALHVLHSMLRHRFLPPSAARRPHLVLGQQGQVEQDLDGLGVRCHHHHLADTAVESFGGCSMSGGGMQRSEGSPRPVQHPRVLSRTACSPQRTLVGALLQLLVVGRLLDDVHYGVGELHQRGSGQVQRGPGLGKSRRHAIRRPIPPERPPEGRLWGSQPS